MKIKTAHFFYYLLSIVLLNACNRFADYSDADKENPITRNDDNLVFKSNSMFNYAVKYIDSDKQEKEVLMNQASLSFDDPYPVIPLDSGCTYQQAQVKSFRIFVEEARADNEHNTNQSTIRYQYFNGSGDLMPIELRTGVVDNQSNIWLHPPRDSFFKVLNLSAYPFVKFPLQTGKKWVYELKVGKYWGHADFGKDWPEDGLLFTHTYEVKGKKEIMIGNKLIDCFHIQAETKSGLGTSGSNFYYNKILGFVRMEFNQLNGSEMQFEIIL